MIRPLKYFRRRSGDDDTARLPTVELYAVGLCFAVLVLVWVGYIATREWRRGETLLLERRATAAVARVGAALNRDMNGAWTTVLAPMSQLTIEDVPYGLLQLTARAFARFPYPESFIVWKDDGSQDGLTSVFNRADRPPGWHDSRPTNDPYPVVLVENPPGLRDVIADIRRQAASGHSFVLREVTIGGVPYQIVAHLLFRSTPPHNLSALSAFTVNLQWVRQEYFGPLLVQVAKIGGYGEALTFAVVDDRGTFVASNGSMAADLAGVRRFFPLLFLDSALGSSLPTQRPAIHEWSIHVGPRPGNTLAAALRGARWMFVLMVLAAAASLMALLLTVRANRATAVVASMKSDFVASVSHELKTPLALIRLVGDTLALGRYTSTQAVQDYAGLLSQEALSLSQSIDRLLACARFSDSSNQLELAPTDVSDLVEDALERFQPLLAQCEFQVTIDVPRTLPRVRADRMAMTHVIENVIDNAIKYSTDTRDLSIVGRSHDGQVRVTFADRGIGITKDDLARVFERFYRGRNVKQGGSGLGLAIARRILESHGGTIGIRSTLGIGTEVDLVLVAVSRL